RLGQPHGGQSHPDFQQPVGRAAGPAADGCIRTGDRHHEQSGRQNMRAESPQPGSGQRGMVLISSLLLLLIITILGVGMFRSFSVQEKVAGNVREKQRALQAAEIAQQYAEWWLAQGNNSATSPVVCNSLL